jgi:hypothetical protein
LCFSAYSTAVSRSFRPSARNCGSFHGEIERHRGQFEADLIVALAGGAVADGVRAGLMRDQYLVFRDQRTRDAGAEQIVGLVGGVRAKHREAVFFRELLPQILHHDLVGAALVRLLLDAFQLAALTELRRERDELHAGITRLEPRQDDGRIQTTGVGEDDFLGRRTVRH